MPTEKLLDALANELLKIEDNREFVVGVMSNAKGEENWQTMLDYIRMARRLDTPVTYDDIVRLSMILGRETER